MPATAEQTLHFAEIFAGRAAVSRALANLGFQGRCMDRDYHEGHDIMKPMGLLLVLSTALELMPGGVFWCAPPCSTWVFMSRATTGRHILIEGDTLYPGVVMSNALVERLVLLLEILSLRGVYWIIEQPMSSLMWQYPAMAGCLRRHGLAPVHLDMGAYGGRSLKPTHLVGTAPYIQDLRRSCSALQRQRLATEGVATATATLDEHGRKRPQGTAALKGTQAYPEGFGASHALAFQRHFGEPAAGHGQTAHPLPSPPPPKRSRGAPTAERWQELLGQLPPELQASLQGAWWLRDFLGEPW